MGIAIHNLSASDGEEVSDLAAALRGTASGILGTTVQMADLVCAWHGFGMMDGLTHSA